MYKVVC